MGAADVMGDVSTPDHAARASLRPGPDHGPDPPGGQPMPGPSHEEQDEHDDDAGGSQQQRCRFITAATPTWAEHAGRPVGLDSSRTRTPMNFDRPLKRGGGRHRDQLTTVWPSSVKGRAWPGRRFLRSRFSNPRSRWLAKDASASAGAGGTIPHLGIRAVAPEGCGAKDEDSEHRELQRWYVARGYEHYIFVNMLQVEPLVGNKESPD